MNTGFFDQDNNAIKAYLIKESIKQTNELLEGVSSKQEVVVIDEYLEKIHQFLSSVLQHPENFHQLTIKLDIKRLINPIVTKDAYDLPTRYINDSTLNHVHSSVEIVDRTHHESTVEYTFTKRIDSASVAQFKQDFYTEIKTFINNHFDFNENYHVHGMIVDITLTAYDLDHEIISQIRLEEMFKNAPEPEYNVDLIQNHYISF